MSENTGNIWKYWKCLKISENTENVKKFWKYFWKYLKILKMSENTENIWKYWKYPKVLKINDNTDNVLESRKHCRSLTSTQGSNIKKKKQAVTRSSKGSLWCWLELAAVLFLEGQLRYPSDSLGRTGFENKELQGLIELTLCVGI